MNHYSMEVLSKDRTAGQRREAAQHNLALSGRSPREAAWRAASMAVAARAIAASRAVPGAVGRLRLLVVRLAASA